MAITKTVAELEAEYEAIDAQIAELLAIPLSGTVGRTTINMQKNLDALERRREWILDQIAAAYRAQGTRGPARREPV